MKANDILECSWGYDQTNVDFYKVLKIKNGWATVQAVGTKEVSDSGFMTTLATPDLDIKGKTFRRKIHNYGFSGDCISISSYASANVWGGQPVRASHYA